MQELMIPCTMMKNVRFFLRMLCLFFFAAVMLIVLLNDIFNSKNYLAAYRRAAVFALMPLVTYLNHKKLHRLSKSIFLFFPGFILLGVPIMVGDLFPGQLIWFQYAAAVFCSIPIILFSYTREKLYIAIFFCYYLSVTLFIDKLLLYYIEIPDDLRELVTDFTEFKIPPLFVAFFSTTTLLWYNRTNSRYEERLRNANLELRETHEELIAKNDEFEAAHRNLEALVKERTKVIELKNKQIIDYANINAHKVRGPLARIMGLINISDYAENLEELKHIFEKLKSPSQELNIIIKEINRTLDEGSTHNIDEE